MESEDQSVTLHVYDLSRGLAAMMSAALLGKQLEGIWHTGVVVYGREYFFGSAGIQSCEPGGTILGEPDRVEILGITEVPYQLYLEYVFGLGETKYKPGTYDLFSHNCNNFSDELSGFLVGTGIPKFILDLPAEVLNTPLGKSLEQFLCGFSLKTEGSGGVAFGSGSSDRVQRYVPSSEREPSPDLLELNTRIEEVRKNSEALEEQRNQINEKILKQDKKERKKKKKKEKKNRGKVQFDDRIEVEGESSSDGSPSHTQVSEDRLRVPTDSSELVSDSSEHNNHMAEMSEQDMKTEVEEEEEKEKKPKKPREPAIVFKNGVNPAVEQEGLEKSLDSVLNPEEKASLVELRQYVIDDEGSWALGDSFFNFVGRVLHDKSLQPQIRVHLLRLLSVAAIKDDIILILHQDRREHHIMNFAHDCDHLPVEEQEALALFICNLFENTSSSEWLLYISEWELNKQSLSNIRVTTKVAVNSLLSDKPELQDYGSAIMYNLATKEKFRTNAGIRELLPKGSLNQVFDDVATELAMAIMQFFNGTPPEEQLFRCMKALHKFATISQNDVPALIKMIGPEPSKFKGVSDRVDDFIMQLNTKLATVGSM